MNKKYIIGLWAFPWFYNTWIEFDYDLCLSVFSVDNEWNSTYEEFDEQYTVDYQKYKTDVTEIFVEEFINNYHDKLLDVWIIIEWIHKMWSPQYYNYWNDWVNIIVDVDMDKLLTSIKEWWEPFDKYLHDHCSSYDWFISFVPNNIWAFELDLFDENQPYANPDWCLQVVIDYIVHVDKNEWYRSIWDSFFYDVIDKIYPYNYVTLKNNEQ